jgi:general secretion pathway protein K
MLIRFLTLSPFGLDARQAGDIVDAIRDWIDEDDEITGFGAESMYYEALEQPYPCKNGPLDSLDELLQIRGVSRELYDGTDEDPGIRHYMTVQDTGTINLNTAPPLVLAALADGITEEMVSRMEEFRGDENNDLSSPSWYKQVPGMDAITISPSLIATKSDIFEISATGFLNRMSRRIQAVVKRDSSQKTVAILSWKAE